MARMSPLFCRINGKFLQTIRKKCSEEYDMGNLSGLNPKKVFEFFEEICMVPRGSGNMEQISKYCMDFAQKRSLKAVCDENLNVIIFKDGTTGYENSDTVMLQGHMDIVCQKEAGLEFDFEKQGIVPYIDGDYVKAKGTTLGADNGIAMAMILAILDSNDLAHPPIEAVFTIDEEVGLIGAAKLNCEGLKSKKMINLDAEDPKTVTVSCAGGFDFKMHIPLEKTNKIGKCVKVVLEGLKGGHSGIEIDKGRVNADILAGRVLNHLSFENDFEIIALNGGDKGNAIPNRCEISIMASDSIVPELENYLNIIKNEIADREPGFNFTIEISEGNFDVISSPKTKETVFMLSQIPNGVVDMSASIEDLVETSLNLGVLKTEADEILLHFMVRSNKKSGLEFLEEKLKTFAATIKCNIESYGHYPPWELNSNSALQEICKEVFREKTGFEPEIVAIHAGLECGMFSDKLKGLDCVAIGPELIDVHTINEKLKISSVKDIYECVLGILEKCR